MSVTHEKTFSQQFDNSRALRALQLARDTLQIEADAILALKDRLSNSENDEFARAAALLLGCSGRVVVSGMGKSGHIARKIAATLASTGTPALFVHPGEAAHGDLGMVTNADAFIAISNSGESEELMAILPVIKRLGAKLISMTGRPESSLARLADVHLNVAVAKEACPLNLAPTASTTATLAWGMHWQSPCWMPGDFVRKISPGLTPAAHSGEGCSPMCAMSCAPVVTSLQSKPTCCCQLRCWKSHARGWQ